VSKGEATQPKHILISFVGSDIAKQDKSITKTKEEAKQLADEIAAKVKANPASFQQYLKSSDKGSAQQGGIVGWNLPVKNNLLNLFKILSILLQKVL
jgi:peptidyl-prolyl cis-trans isomerase D